MEPRAIGLDFYLIQRGFKTVADLSQAHKNVANKSQEIAASATLQYHRTEL